jgi:hypothetical protein
MTRTILKTVLCGIMVGALAFFVPGLLVGLFVFMLIARLFCGCRSRHYCGGHCCGHGRGGRFEMMDKIRTMSEADYAEFKSNHGHGCCHSGKRSECKTPTTESTK